MVRKSGERDPSHIVVVQTVEAHLARRARRLREAPSPGEVDLTRVTVIDASPSRAPQDDSERVDVALSIVGRALTAHRVAIVEPSDPGSPPEPLATRVGVGTGPQVADGLWMEAREPKLPRRRTSRRRPPASDERFAALLGGRQEFPACALVALRARADLNAGRTREAALMIEAALGAARNELRGKIGPARREELAAHSGSAAAAAEAAREGPVDAAVMADAEAALSRLEAALKSLALDA